MKRKGKSQGERKVGHPASTACAPHRASASAPLRRLCATALPAIPSEGNL